MIKCSRCGHHNLPSFPTCSKCGTAIAGGGAPGSATAPSPGASAGASDDYGKLLASRAAAGKRNRLIYGVVGLVATGVVGFKLVKDRMKSNVAQEKLAYFDRWVAEDKREAGSFWNCVMASEVDVGTFSNATQVQQRVEAAYATQQKTYAEYLVNECIPKVERAREVASSTAEAPAEFIAPIAAYRDTLKKMQEGIEAYAQKVKGRQGTKEVDQLIAELGGAWHVAGSPPMPGAIAFEKFLYCAIPDLEKLPGAQQMLEFLADACYKKDPVVFMTRVRDACGPLLANIDAQAAPPKTWDISRKRFFEEDARQMQAWESCSRRSRKGMKVNELGEFLRASGNYLQARNAVAKTAREIAASGH